MGKFDEKVALYKATLEGMGMQVNDDLLTKVTRGCGPSIYNADAEKVSSSDKSELETVKNNFLIGKMGQADGANLDNAIDKVIHLFGKGNANKYRAVFYYLLVKELGLEGKY